jgi:sugar (pentulose or hexulose) kinase
VPSYGDNADTVVGKPRIANAIGIMSMGVVSVARATHESLPVPAPKLVSWMLI